MGLKKNRWGFHQFQLIRRSSHPKGICFARSLGYVTVSDTRPAFGTNILLVRDVGPRAGANLVVLLLSETNRRGCRWLAAVYLSKREGGPLKTVRLGA